MVRLLMHTSPPSHPCVTQVWEEHEVKVRILRAAQIIRVPSSSAVGVGVGCGCGCGCGRCY